MINKRFVPLIAAAFSLLMAVVLVVGAAAAPDPFRGKWYSTDVDFSSQSLVMGGGPGGSYHVRYYDAGASVCGWTVGSSGPAASAQGFLSLTAAPDPTISGNLQVYCLTSPPTPYPAAGSPSAFSFTYVPATDELIDGHGVVWSH